MKSNKKNEPQLNIINNINESLNQKEEPNKNENSQSHPSQQFTNIINLNINQLPEILIKNNANKNENNFNINKDPYISIKENSGIKLDDLKKYFEKA